MSLVCLVGKVSGLVSETYRFKEKIRRCTLAKRRTDRLVKTRKDIKNDIRHHLLAYAFIGGNKYHKLEARCAVAPSVEKILLITRLHQDSSGWFNKFDKLSDEELKLKIVNWLNGV